MSSTGSEAAACRSCGASNPEGSQFCGSCGAGLAAVEACPRCGTENPVGQSFCNSCGASLDAGSMPDEAPLSATQPELDGERKQVTVLFADVKGSMDMAEQIDPEEWRQIMQRFFSLLSEGVRRFEGTVDKFTGDGIMALFGAPIAHEDHAPRACFAALHIGELVSEYAGELRRAKGLSFSVRIGINSGEVVAGAIGEDSEPEYTAVGHTVGLAQRMEALAEPGKAYLTEHAAKLAEGYLELKDLGEFEVKGASRPIQVFELIGAGSARSRLDLSRERGLSPIRRQSRGDEGPRGGARAGQGGTGRGDRRGRRSRASARAASATSSRSDAGHAGSRSTRPRLRRMARRSRSCRCCRCCAATSGSRIATPSGSPGRRSPAGCCCSIPTSRTTCRSSSTSSPCPIPERPAPQVSAEARQRLLRGVIRRLYRVPGRTEVVVNVIEDLHWMDEGSEAFLAEMVGAVEGTATLAVVNFRPEYEADVGRLAGLPADHADAARTGLDQGAADRPGRRRSLARRSRRADPRANRRQPVLHRGGRPRAGRGRHTSRATAARTG